MAIRELDAGQSHTFALSALRVQLTGVLPGEGVTLRALDQAGAESVTVRLTDVEVVLTPKHRRLRLSISPTDGGSFPAETNIGLTLRTEGVSAAAEQIIVSPVDVGALARCELAVLEFAESRAILTVSANQGGTAPTAPRAVQTFTSGTVFATTPSTPVARTAPPDHDLDWLQPGRYALRDAESLGEIGQCVSAWAVVLDGSASMQGLARSGQLAALLGLVCGTYVQWTGAWPMLSTVTGVRNVDVDAATDPRRLVDQALSEGGEPSSWLKVADSVERIVQMAGVDCAALVVSDGVPGDVQRLADVARRQPGVRITVVTPGVSAYGLASDTPIDWWEEELAGFRLVEEVPNLRVIAVRANQGGHLDLSGKRAAELALRLTGPIGLGVGA